MSVSTVYKLWEAKKGLSTHSLISAGMKLNIVSRKLIKPCNPTPQNLSKYKISLIDELMPPINGSLLLYYPAKLNPSNLEKSLAEILARFYVLAGRYVKKDHLVDCSDQGAEFLEAEAEDVNFELIDPVGKLNAEQLNDLLPRQVFQAYEAATDPLLSIQVTNFNWGGVVIGVSISHRIFDASSIESFILAWSNVSNPRPGAKITISPSFKSPSLFPGKHLDYATNIEPSEIWDPNIILKRFFFTMEAITNLRSKLNQNNRKKSSRGISRVRVVCALIAKALIRLDEAKYGKSRPCLISQPVNIRERIIPPLDKHSCGNLSIPSLTRCMDAAETKKIGIQELVNVLGDAIDKTIADCSEILSLGEDGLNNVILNPLENLKEKGRNGELNVVSFSDWSKFGFYEVDFGSGKPVWATIGPLRAVNTTVLMVNKQGDGIEAWVHLKQNDMNYFEQDEDIKFFMT